MSSDQTWNPALLVDRDRTRYDQATPSRTLILSVVVPVFNERLLVAELLRRVLAVRSPDVTGLEVIVVDDGSTDGSRGLSDDVYADDEYGPHIFQLGLMTAAKRPEQ